MQVMSQPIAQLGDVAKGVLRTSHSKDRVYGFLVFKSRQMQYRFLLHNLQIYRYKYSSQKVPCLPIFGQYVKCIPFQFIYIEKINRRHFRD